MTTPHTPAPRADLFDLPARQNDWTTLNRLYDQISFDGWVKGHKYHFVASIDRIGAVEEGLYVETYEVFADDTPDAHRYIRLEFDREVAEYVKNRVNEAFWSTYERR